MTAAEPNIHPTVVNIDWTAEPSFAFATEVDALMTLQDLAEELASAREQERQVMRYMLAAVKAAGEVREDGDDSPIKPQAIINHSGLARQTVYDALGPR